MGNKLYLECGSGISGDMFVGAMLDLGADQKKMEEALQSLPVDGFKTEITRVKKSGLDAYFASFPSLPLAFQNSLTGLVGCFSLLHLPFLTIHL